MKIKSKKAVVEDYTVWILVGLLVLALGAVIAYFALKKGLINIDYIKNLFR